MHLSVFTPRMGAGGGRRQEYPGNYKFLKIWGLNSLPTSHKYVSNIPWICLIIYTEFLLEFQSKVSKVPSLFQSVLTNSRGK